MSRDVVAFRCRRRKTSLTPRDDKSRADIDSAGAVAAMTNYESGGGIA